MKKIILTLVVILAIILVAVGSYVAYVYLSYHRLDDKISLHVKNNQIDEMATNTTYTALSFNIGYGAYPKNYSFFMAGGKYSRAYDKETVLNDIDGVLNIVQKNNPDLAMFQEVDVTGDRSFHVDQVAMIYDNLTDYTTVFAQNYDSAYLFYPVTKPIGKAKSGLVTAGKFEITDSMRYSLPIETNFNKFFDLDRAFSVSHLSVEGGKTLALINTHMSAFTKDPAVLEAQVNKLFSKMADEYQKGHYVLVAGDYNHDLLGNSPEVFNTKTERETWTQPFPESELPAGFSIAKGTLAETAVPSVRDSNKGYVKGTTYVSLIDGFLVSENVKVEIVEALDEEFKFSDHNPVKLTFQLIE